MSLTTSEIRNGAEGGIRTLTGLLPTDFKSFHRYLTTCYYMIQRSIYRRFSRQSSSRPTWYQNIAPSSFPHLCEGQLVTIGVVFGQFPPTVASALRIRRPAKT
jgi:hypothetical protein